MVHRKLKRLPVVDEDGRLVGIVSRVDLLQTVADFGARKQAEQVSSGLREDARLSEVMREDVPTVSPDSPLGEVVQAVTSTRLNRALVVDPEGRLLGIVHARAVLERVTPALRPSLLRSLVHRLPFRRPSDEERETERHANARTAAELMSTDIMRVPPDIQLREVIVTMVEGGRKLVAVVDDGGRLLGVVDRADVLRGIVNQL
jgi:CBS domain-containing protein